MEPDQKKVRRQCLRGPAPALGIFLLRYSRSVTDSILRSRTAPLESQSVGVLNHPLFTCEESQISISVTKYPQKSNLKEESFILAPGFRDFCPCLLGAFVLGTVLKQQNVTTEEMVKYSSSFFS